jgi:VIT1/CCC1 family predicted Fe2+/Mn2+ transporter
MTTQPYGQRGAEPAESSAGRRHRRSGRHLEEEAEAILVRHPLTWTILWGVGALCGGLLFILLFFATMGVVSFYQQPWLGVAALVMTLLFLVAMTTYGHQERKRHVCRRDRERRGF